MIGQLEQGESGTPHFQFVLHLHKRVRLTFFKKWNKDVAAYPAGEPKGAITYVTKEDTRIEGPWELGTKPSLRGGDHKSFTFKDLISKTYDEA